MRGLMKVNIEGVMIAAGQNLKRLVKYRLEDFCAYSRNGLFRRIAEKTWGFSTTWFLLDYTILFFQLV
jgi:hypothetical protein